MTSHDRSCISSTSSVFLQNCDWNCYPVSVTGPLNTTFFTECKKDLPSIISRRLVSYSCLRLSCFDADKMVFSRQAPRWLEWMIDFFDTPWWRIVVPLLEDIW